MKDKYPCHRCPTCGSDDIGVKDSRPTMKDAVDPIIRRRRVCNTCKGRWSTYEITDRTYEKMLNLLAELSAVLPNMKLGPKGEQS